jgi:hypothetical protein
LKSAHAWHLHVENKTRRNPQTPETQEFLSRGEDLNSKAERFDQPSGCLADRSVIVNQRQNPNLWQLALHC